jgi:hypothetical protein
MKKLLHVLVVAPLAFAGAPMGISVAWAAPPSPATQTQPQPETATPAAPVADRSAYLQKAKAQLHEWRVKLDGYAESAKAKTEAAQTAAAEDLNKAWTKTKIAADRLETATAAEWQSAKDGFQKESDALSAAWAKKPASTSK